MLRYATCNEVVLQLSRGALSHPTSHTIPPGGPNLNLLNVLMTGDAMYWIGS